MTDAQREPMSQAQALELFEYRDGVLYWRVRSPEQCPSARARKSFNKNFAGKPTGQLKSGYLYTRQMMAVHRIVWLMFHGTLPPMLDHINGKPLDNRLENLRPVTPRQNSINRRTTAASGEKGVYRHVAIGKWTANIRVDGKLIHLGSYNSFGEAAQARRQATEKYHGEYARR